MSDAIIVAIITGACTLTGSIVSQVILYRRAADEMYNKLERQSELSDARIEAKFDKSQAVTDAKIEELSRNIHEHNQFAKRVPILEAKMEMVEKKLERRE